MTNWRSIGDIPFDLWRETLVNAGSPLVSTAKNVYDVARPHTALALAQMRVESQYATSFSANSPANKNALNLRPRGGGDGFQRFDNWEFGVREWERRITDPTYAYKDTVTIADLIHVFAPSSDGNNEASYVASIEADLRKWGVAPKETPMPTKVYQVVGLPGPGIELLVPLAHRIIALSQPKQRPGIKRHLPGDWVQHETANMSPGADAEMHARFLERGAPNDQGVSQQLSYHFTVDDGQIIQLIPIDEVTWQAADGSGPGNMGGISCELCVNAGIDTAKARHNAEALCGGVLKALVMGPEHIKRHWDFNGALPPSLRHHCPDEMMTENYWPTFVANAAKIITGNITTPAFATPAPITWNEGDVGIHDLNGTPALAFKIQVKVTAGKVIPQVSETDKTQAGPLRKKNTLLTAIGVYRDAQRRPFVVLRDKTRVPYKSVRPLVPLPPIAA